MFLTSIAQSLKRSHSIGGKIAHRTFSNGTTATKRISTALPTTVPKFVRIVEVGPRDGLQNEKSMVTAATKLALIDKLYKAGLRSIEAGAFVSPKWVPQMADTEEIFRTIGGKQEANEYPGATFSALTPNLQGKKKRHIRKRQIRDSWVCQQSKNTTLTTEQVFLRSPQVELTCCFFLCSLPFCTYRIGEGYRTRRKGSGRVRRSL